MKPVRLVVIVALVAGSVGSATAQSALPLVDDVEFTALREHCQRLRKALDGLKAPLPADLDKQLDVLLSARANDLRATEKVQKLLDAHCLCGVTINPESRVSATRGPLSAELVRDRPVLALIKVCNNAGVTAKLAIEGPQLRRDGKAEAERWLEVAVQTEAPLARTLSGQKLEYVVVALMAREAGKREATLRFDVGQGTQDLGFRAEVPILFIVRGAN